MVAGASSSAAAGSLSATPSGLSRHFAIQAEVLQVAVHDGVDDLKSTILNLKKGVAEAKEEATKGHPRHWLHPHGSRDNFLTDFCTDEAADLCDELVMARIECSQPQRFAGLLLLAPG
ncbi:hypothetical protein QJQ45_022535 [Haematococcus lacustris]|nr:hypothetical protein QJQ45_022535 [Haematococcus lacustris]